MYYILAVYTVQALTQTFNSADLRVHEPAGIRVHVYHVHGADVLLHTHTHTPTCMCILPTCACTMPTCVCTCTNVHVHGGRCASAQPGCACAQPGCAISGFKWGQGATCCRHPGWNWVIPWLCRSITTKQHARAPFRPDTLYPYLALLLTQTQVFWSEICSHLTVWVL